MELAAPFPAWTVHHGDCIEIMRSLPDASVDAIVTDPPYGLEFMGKSWDRFDEDSRARAGMSGTGYTDGAERLERPSFLGGLNPKCRSCGKWQRGGNPCSCGSPNFPNERRARSAAFGEWCELWTAECLRVLKPGGHMLAFGGTRTWHRLVVAVEDAGFEIRDSIAWLYGSGFPKSLDVSKAIDKAAGAEREVVGPLVSAQDHNSPGTGARFRNRDVPRVMIPTATAPATPDAERWQGWGTALKPAWESIVVGQKPADQWARVGSHLAALEDECRQSANGATRSSAPIPAASPEVRTATAPASAATPHEDAPARTTPTGAADDSSAATDTSASESTDATCLSIVTSWRACWADLSSPTSTSTTGTTSSTTTDLTTLWSCLSRLTHPSTLLDPTSPDGLSSLARAADNLFAAAVLSSNATRTLTATEPATSPTPRPSQAAGGLEPIVVARKPLTGTVAQTVLAHGTGALNIDACRVASDGESLSRAVGGGGSFRLHGFSTLAELEAAAAAGGTTPTGRDAAATLARFHKFQDAERTEPAGRWPTNVVLDGHTADALDEQSGYQRDGVAVRRNVGKSGGNFPFGRANPDMREDVSYGSGGGASRFFPTFRYQAKAPARERPRYEREGGSDNATTYGQMKKRECNVCGSRANPAGGEHSGKPWPSCGHDDWSWVEQQSARDEFVAHPTVKPLELMRWLVRLVTPPGGVILDPFAGSGTTVEAALLEGFACIAIEREADYLPLIHARIKRSRGSDDSTNANCLPLGQGSLFDTDDAS